MAIGDDALNAGMEILDGNELSNTLDTEINKTRDYVAQRTSAVTPVAEGGTGATTAQGAQINLDVVGNDQVVVSTSGVTVANKIPRYDGAGRIVAGTPSAANHAASKSYVDNGIAGRFPAAGGTMPGSLGVVGTLTVLGNGMFPNASAATSGWTVAYINSDGRLSRGSSSERYKKYISDIDPASLGDIFPQFVRYQMKGGDGSWKYGYIAERLDESEALKPFVVYQTVNEHDEETDTWTTRLALDEAGNPVPESIDFIMLILAQNAQLNERVKALEAAA